MTYPAIGIIVAVTVLLGACAHPQSADEFRKSVSGASSAKAESREVNRPLREVAATFRARAPECLNATVRRTVAGPTYHVIDIAYAPTVVVTDQKVELHVQMRYVRGVINVAKEPEGGVYVLIADVHPVDSKRSRVEMFAMSGYDVVKRAIMGWATGKDLGCPDMTQ